MTTLTSSRTGAARRPAASSTQTEVALAISFLVSDESVMVNDRVIDTDAGSSLLSAARDDLASKDQD